MGKVVKAVEGVKGVEGKEAREGVGLGVLSPAQKGYLARCGLVEAERWGEFASLFVGVERVSRKGVARVVKVPVGLNLVLRGEEEVRAFVEKGKRGAVECVTFEGEGDELEGWVDSLSEMGVGVYREADLGGLPEKVPGVTVLVDISGSELRDGLREVESVCGARGDVRFTGGSLLEIPGVRIGRWKKASEVGEEGEAGESGESGESGEEGVPSFVGKGVSEKERVVVWKDFWDIVEEVPLGVLEGKLKGTKEKIKLKKVPGVKKMGGVRKESAPRKNSKVMTFESLFGEEGSEF